MEIPTTFDEVTPQWLTDALHASGDLPPSARVIAREVERIGEGVGFVGQIGRMRLSYDAEAAGAPPSVIAKLPSDDEGARTIGSLFGLYEREVRFYEHVGESVEVRIPRCYWAAADKEADRYALLFEDMSLTGRVGDQVAGCTEEEALLAVRELAHLHAHWWSSPKLESFGWMNLGADLVRVAMQFAYAGGWGTALERFGDHMTPEVRSIVEGLAPKLLRLMDVLQAEAPLTIVHGDFRLDNMFFGHEGAPYRIAIIDWQSPNRGWGAYDLAYFLGGNVRPEQRRAWEREMLGEYHGALTEAGVRGYSPDQLRRDYRRSLMVYLGIMVVDGAMLEVSNERAFNLMAAMFGRLSSAIIELDAAATLPE